MESVYVLFFFFFQAEDGIRDMGVTGVQTCALPICARRAVMTEKKRLPPLLKLVLELGPLVLFFVTNAYADRFGYADHQRIYAATAVFIFATAVALSVNYLLIRKLPIMPMVSGVVVLVFGGLTLALQNEVFIKLKPTIVNAMFGMVLLGGLYFRKPLL